MATEGFVCWTECEGDNGPCQYITNRGGGIDFRARINTITKPSDATLILLNQSGTFEGIECNIYRVLPIAPTVSTTTTTAPPISLTLTASCIGTGINGTGRIVANGFTGGTGTYANIKIGNTLSAALGATPIVLSGATSYQWDNLLNQTYYVVLTDSANNTNYASVGVNCTNTTTTTSTSTTTTSTSTTSTTSTTTLAPICTYNGGTAVVVYPSTTTTSTTTTLAPTTTTTTTTSAPTTTTTTTTSAPTSAILQWDFELIGGADAAMTLYINGVNTLFTNVNDSGVYNVYEGDTIEVLVDCNTCLSSPNVCATAESQSNKSSLDASNTVNGAPAQILTSAYTVVSGDIGNNINLSAFGICNSTCL
jgi:hypothetical protein